MQPSGSGLDLAVLAREIIDANRYMTLATADGDGRPWPAPVWYAHQGYTDFLWVSRPDTRHSRNLAGRPELARHSPGLRSEVTSAMGLWILADGSEGLARAHGWQGMVRLGQR